MCELCLSPFIIHSTSDVRHHDEQQGDKHEKDKSDHEPSLINHQEAPAVPPVELL